MSTFEKSDLDEIGWQLDVDTEAEEIHLEHHGTGDSFVLDADGSFRVSGNGVTGEDLRELQEKLAAATVSNSGVDSSAENILDSNHCRITCDETGTLSIEADRKIDIEAPQMELSSDATFDINCRAHASIEAEGVLTLNGAQIHLN